MHEHHDPSPLVLAGNDRRPGAASRQKQPRCAIRGIRRVYHAVKRVGEMSELSTTEWGSTMNAVFNLPERPNPRSRGFESVLCSKSHHRRDAHQLASPVAFFHLAVDQTRRYVPSAYVAPLATHLAPVSKMGRERIKVHM